MSIRTDQINALVEQYNRVEQEQVDRLREIHHLVREGKGFKRVAFKAVTWSSLWTMPEAMACEREVDVLANPVTSVDPGDD